MIEKDPDAGGRYVVIDDWPHLFVADRRALDKFKLKDMEAVVADGDLRYGRSPMEGEIPRTAAANAAMSSALDRATGVREIGGQVRVRADLARSFEQFAAFVDRAAAAMQGEMMREFFLLYREPENGTKADPAG